MVALILGNPHMVVPFDVNHEAGVAGAWDLLQVVAVIAAVYSPRKAIASSARGICHTCIIYRAQGLGLGSLARGLQWIHGSFPNQGTPI